MPSEARITHPVILVRFHAHSGQACLIWLSTKRREMSGKCAASWEGPLRTIDLSRGGPGSLRDRGLGPCLHNGLHDENVPSRWEFVGRVADPAVRERDVGKSVRSHL